VANIKTDNNMIAVLGLGFVGLTTAIGLAEKTGRKVIGFDIDAARSRTLQEGKLPFHEPDLGDYLQKHLKQGSFKLASSLADAVVLADTIFFCVGTPSNDDGRANLTYLTDAIEATLDVDDTKRLLVVKSTVPPHTSCEVILPLLERRGLVVGHDTGLASNPEFLREGHCWADFMNPDRIVIGADDDYSAQTLSRLYSVFNAPIILTSRSTAEYIKYLSNTLLATMISFSNEMAMIADRLGDVDVGDAFKALHMDRRWTLPEVPDTPDGGDKEATGSTQPVDMASYVLPGSGFGGYCLPKDTKAMAHLAQQCGIDALMLHGTLETNELIKRHRADLIASRCTSKDTRIGIIGLSFKPGSDDVRDTPAAAIISHLLQAGYHNITVYDPFAMETFAQSYALPINYAHDRDALLASCEIIEVIKDV
jgi:UDPglucose 6-dehydrogenase